jgi:serine/threonine protein kinase
MSDITVGAEIARGANGVVHRATWQTTDIALKSLFLLDSEALRAIGIVLPDDEMQTIMHNFVQECEINAQLHHPNIVQFLGVAVNDNFQPRKLMLEYLSGGNLTSALHPINTLESLDRQLAVMVDIATALQYLHSRQPAVLHLDIKPDNILFDNTGRAKLADLGEAHVIRSSHTLATSTIGLLGVGTPLYMAPEMRYEDQQKGTRSDMFSMGVVMCEMSSGVKPNPGHETVRVDELTIRVNREENRRSADIALMRNAEVRHIVKQLIKHSMRDRWSAEQVLQYLQHVAAGGTNSTSSSQWYVRCEQQRWQVDSATHSLLAHRNQPTSE